MVLDSKFPSDLRVEKELSALVPDFKVHVLCASDSPNNSQFHEEQLSIGPKSSKLSKGLRDIVLGLTGFDPVMYFRVKRAIKLIEPAVIHVHDLPQFNTVYKANRKKAILVLDMHENYPEATEIWFRWRKSKVIQLKNKIINDFSRWKKFEKQACINADFILAVVDEMKAKVIRDHNIDPEKVLVVSNTESRSFAENFNRPPTAIATDLLTSNAFNLLYVGGIGPHRGLDDAITGLELFCKQHPDEPIAMHIIGGGNADNINYLKELANSLDIQDKVVFHKPVKFQYVSELMQAADLNIIPHKSNGHCDNTIPHKLFQTMMSGSPVLVSSSSPLARTVQSVDGGFVFEADNPRDFAKELKEIVDNPEARKEKARNAKHATVAGNLNWETTSIDLKMLYQQIFDQCTI